MTIKNFIEEKIKENLPADQMAQVYAQSKVESVIEYLGKGTFGDAYLTSSSSVIKITRDNREVYAAMKLIGLSSEHVVSIKEIVPISDQKTIIYQEYAENNSQADDLFWELSSISDANGFEDINELINHNNIEDCVFEEHLLNVIEQFKEAESFMLNAGIKSGGLDLQTDNFSYINGKIKTFDNIDASLTQKEAKLLIKKENNSIIKLDKNKDGQNKRKPTLP